MMRIDQDFKRGLPIFVKHELIPIVLAALELLAFYVVISLIVYPPHNPIILGMTYVADTFWVFGFGSWLYRRIKKYGCLGENEVKARKESFKQQCIERRKLHEEYRRSRGHIW